MELGQRIKAARLEAGLSQRQLCGEEITRNMLSQIENGVAKPSMATLQYLAAQLRKPVSFFLEEAAASPNQVRMDEARAAFLQEDYRQVLAHLADFASPDPVFDGEKHLLEALSCIFLAEKEPDANLLAQAAVAGAKTPYYTPELERRRLLCLAQLENVDLHAIAPFLAPDRELLTLAHAALTVQEFENCLHYLNAVQDKGKPWLFLRADLAFQMEDYAQAADYYSQTADPSAYPQLEVCYQKLEDYKMAYYYACLQR